MLAKALADEFIHVRPLVVDVRAHQGAATQIAAALETGITYVESLVSLGMPGSVALDQLIFRLGDTDESQTSRNLVSGLRRCWQRVCLERLGATRPAKLHLVVPGRVTRPARSVWEGLVHAVEATFAASESGADILTLTPIAVDDWLEKAAGEALAFEAIMLASEIPRARAVGDG